jgi:hypothetical protein
MDVTRSWVQIIPIHLSPHGSLPSQFDGLVSQEAAIPVRPAAANIDRQEERGEQINTAVTRLKEEARNTYCLAHLYQPG